MSHFYSDVHQRRLEEAIKRIGMHTITEMVPLQLSGAVTPEPVPYAARETLAYKAFQKGDCWGRRFDCGWFHLTGKIPESWAGAYVTLHLDFGGELLLYDAEGCPLMGLTNGSVFDQAYSKDHFHWLKEAKGGEAVDFWIEAGANGLFGISRIGLPEHRAPEELHGSWNSHIVYLEAVRFDYDAWQLWNDLCIIQSYLKTQPENSSNYVRTLRSTSKALDLLPPERGGAKAVREYLQKTVWAVGANPGSIAVTAIGHAHIDTAWMWPFRETIRKVGRTWASQISNIARYPGYKFGASQAQLYAYCKAHYPELYAKVKKAVADGDWEVQGGMWVEADCNVPSGESLVRQFFYGERFFKEEFGIVPRNLWLPDVFGYSGNLPQIMRKCGIDFFLTQKLSWNRYNRFPHNTFVWQGIDGSRVVSHFPPEDNYNGALLPETLILHENNNREAGIIDEAISLFGIGDGGGGPKEEFIENGLRTANLNGCPRVHFGFAQAAMDRMSEHEDDLDTWIGELYFEMHRATFTTQCEQKRVNRRAEEALRLAEMLCAAAMDTNAYPQAEITRLWQEVLLCQFHDIIPGSSIHRVYQESGDLVRKVLARANELAAQAARTKLTEDKKSFTLFNPNSTPFTEVIALPENATAATAADGTALPTQTEAFDTYARVTVPPRSFATFTVSEDKVKAVAAEACELPDDGIVLENDLVRYEFNSAMQLVRGVDKQANKCFLSQPGNRLRLMDDHPYNYDAWDFEEYVENMPVDEAHVTSAELIRGPVRQTLMVAYRLGNSTFLQNISLAAHSKRLDFETTVDWKEQHRICRVYFPTEIISDEARFEIQYGTIARSTTDNTKWQYAQYEVVAHRYADLSDHQYGVALLNDSKYGYRVKGKELSMTLLRAPQEPDPVADLGAHHFTYSILPHQGTLDQTDEVVASADALNQGVARYEGFAQKMPSETALPVLFEAEGVDFAVLKKAEDNDGEWVVRLVERRGNHATGSLSLAAGAGTATPCLATELADAGEVISLPATLSFTPFEMKTLRLRK